MSTVRINDNIKKEVVPILEELGLSLSEAINIFLHQVKINKGIPFSIKKRSAVEVNDNCGSYICEYGHLHNYGGISSNDIEQELNNTTTYDSVSELIDDLKGE